MFKIARNFTSFNYGYLITYIKNIDVISQNIVADLLSSIFSTIFLILLSVSYILNKSQRKIIVIGGVFYILSFSTIAAYLFERNTSYIESRYLYAGMISMGIFFAVITDTIKNILLKTRIPKFFSILCLVLSLVVFFYKQIILVQREVYRAVIMAENTKNVLSEFSRVFPILPDKPVIYLTGSDFYYSYLNHYVPLELNPGYIFMIWTYKSGKIPKELLPKELLRGYILSSFGIQWYEEYGGKAFGYYWDKDKLRSKIAEKNLSKSQLVGLYYDGHTNTFKDITNDLRKELFNN